MGREVRRVPKDWKHPEEKKMDPYSFRQKIAFKPLLDSVYYQSQVDRWLLSLKEKGLQETIDDYGPPPDKNDYMLVDVPRKERTHYMMYENTSEGTPISPAFETPEELARWLADTGASIFGRMTASYEQWLAICKNGHGGFGIEISLDGSVKPV